MREGLGFDHNCAIAFAGDPPAQVAYDVSALAPDLSAPRGWIAGAFAASALAFALVLASLARRPFDERGWVPAQHEGGGWLGVGDEAVFAACAASLAPGAVIARVHGPGAGPFRGDALVIDEVIAGTLDEARARSAASAAAPALLAIAAALSIGAPLALAALLGLA